MEKCLYLIPWDDLSVSTLHNIHVNASSTESLSSLWTLLSTKVYLCSLMAFDRTVALSNNIHLLSETPD